MIRGKKGHERVGNGGFPARRAVIRWAWRLLRREWRQQLLILALITVAVAATLVGSAVAINTPPAPGAGFGTATDMATLGPGPHLPAQLAAIAHRFGRVDVIENEALPVPGSVATYSVRAQNPAGPFGQPMLSLVSGHYPRGPGQVALTSGVAAELHLRTGDTWRAGGPARRVTGIVTNPQNLLDEFALVAPGQVGAPTQVTVLFDARGTIPPAISPAVTSRASLAGANALNPVTISLAAATLGMLLIALVAVGGFTVLAQRRLRSIGMLGAQGATNASVGLVVSANGLVTGVVGAVAGFALGLAAWLAYRPRAEASAHHIIGAFQLPWLVILVSMALAVLAAFLAAVRPARAIAKMPIVAALAGRPPAPRRARRWAGPAGAGLLLLAFFLIGLASEQATSAAAEAGDKSALYLALVVGLIVLCAGVVLIAPTCLGLLAAGAQRAPVTVRIAVRDLARYRTRSGAALGAISLSVLIAVIICVVAAARFGSPVDYAGPNLAPDQLIVYPAAGHGHGPARLRARHERPADRHECPPAHRDRILPGPGDPRPAGRDDGAGPRHRGPARVPEHHPARGDRLRAAARRGRAELGRTRVCGHPAAPARVRHHRRAGQPGRRHPHHAARPGGPDRDAAPVRRVQDRPGRARLALPAGLLPGEPGDPGSQRAAVRHVGAEHRDH